jgi:Fic family protein
MMAHYYLTEIHPFVDGNGRAARALEALILNAHGVNDYCFWSWANFWSAHKDQYLLHLQYSNDGGSTVHTLGIEGYR